MAIADLTQCALLYRSSLKLLYPLTKKSLELWTNSDHNNVCSEKKELVFPVFSIPSVIFTINHVWLIFNQNRTAAVFHRRQVAESQKQSHITKTFCQWPNLFVYLQVFFASFIKAAHSKVLLQPIIFLNQIGSLRFFCSKLNVRSRGFFKWFLCLIVVTQIFSYV